MNWKESDKKRRVITAEAAMGEFIEILPLWESNLSFSFKTTLSHGCIQDPINRHFREGSKSCLLKLRPGIQLVKVIKMLSTAPMNNVLFFFIKTWMWLMPSGTNPTPHYQTPKHALMRLENSLKIFQTNISFQGWSKLLGGVSQKRHPPFSHNSHSNELVLVSRNALAPECKPDRLECRIVIRPNPPPPPLNTPW